MDVYVNQIVGNGQPHDLFYTNTDVKVCFDNLIMEIPRSWSQYLIECIQELREDLCRSICERTRHSCLGISERAEVQRDHWVSWLTNCLAQDALCLEAPLQEAVPRPRSRTGCRRCRRTSSLWIATILWPSVTRASIISPAHPPTHISETSLICVPEVTLKLPGGVRGLILMLILLSLQSTSVLSMWVIDFPSASVVIYCYYSRTQHHGVKAVTKQLGELSGSLIMLQVWKQRTNLSFSRNSASHLIK